MGDDPKIDGAVIDQLAKDLTTSVQERGGSAAHFLVPENPSDDSQYYRRDIPIYPPRNYFPLLDPPNNNKWDIHHPFKINNLVAPIKAALHKNGVQDTSKAAEKKIENKSEKDGNLILNHCPNSVALVIRIGADTASGLFNDIVWKKGVIAHVNKVLPGAIVQFKEEDIIVFFPKATPKVEAPKDIPTVATKPPMLSPTSSLVR